MFLLSAIFVALLLVERRRDLLFPVMATPPVFVAVFYGLSKAGLAFPYSRALDLAGLAAATLAVCLVAWHRRGGPRADSTPAREIAGIYLLAAVLCGLVFLALRDSVLLPPVDPATVPSYARLIYLAGRLPDTLAPMSDAPFLYPPGFSILVSTLWVLHDPLRLLWIFKLLNLAVVALLPFGWSHFFGSTLGVRANASPLLVAALFAAGFFVFDGTLVLAPVLAGKNAQLLVLLLAPGVLHGLLDEHRSPARAVMTALALTGSFLIHYSMVYVTALVLLFRAIVDWRGLWARLPWVAGVGAVSAALAAPHYLWMRHAGFALPAEYATRESPVACVAGDLWAAESKFFFIFHDLDLDTRWPYRALVMALIVVAALTADWWRRRTTGGGLGPAARGAVASALLLAFCLGVGCEALPAFGAGYDYVRWFSFPIMVWLFVCAVLVVKTPPWLAWVAAALVPAWLLVSPMVREARSFADAWRYSRAEIAGAAQVLRLVQDGPAPRGRGIADCRLVTSSDRGTSFETRHHIVQRYRPFEYAFVLSDCRVVNGTINYPPEPHARDLDELPSRAFYETLPDDATVVLFLEPARFESYRSRVPEVAFEELPYTLRGLRAYRVR